MCTSGRSVIAVMSVMLLASSLVLSLPARADTDWNVQTVDEKATLSGGLSLAADSRGNPHVVYIATESGNYYTGGHITARVNPQYLTYASWNGSGWDTQTADYFYIPDLRPSTLGSIGGFALDSNNHPHIVYTVAVQNDSESSVGYVKRSILKYASCTGAEWNIQTIDNGTGGSIALDSAGNPHVAYTGGDGQLKYASWNGLAWTVETVDAAGALYQSQSLAIDRNNRPSILYVGSDSTIWAVRNLAVWSLQKVTLNESSSFRNLVLDSRGYPHFVYDWNKSVMYASWDGFSWNTQTVVLCYSLFSGSFLALDFNDNPHITYHNNTDYFVYYARWTGETWNAQKAFQSSYEVQLALDSTGNPHLCSMIRRYEGSAFHMGTVIYATSNQPVPTSIPFALWTGLLALAVLAAIGIFAFKKRQNRKMEPKNETATST